MTRHLSLKEKMRIDELGRNGTSDKEISDQICREFNRETLNRTTLNRLRRQQRSSSPMHLPVTPLEHEAFERCQVGKHGWMVRGDLFVDCYTPKCLSGGEYPTRELIEETYGKRTTTRTCWFCGFTTEPRDAWGQVWVVAA